MFQIDAYALTDQSAGIKPLPLKREWIDELENQGAYRCLPMGTGNTLGYGIYFPDDISFEWDGTIGFKGSIKIHSGHRWIHKDRGGQTLGLNTYIKFKTDENTSLMAIPVPNLFNKDYQAFTAVLSTSFFKGLWEISLQVMTPNKIITIPAGTIVGAIMPISLGYLNNTVLNYHSADVDMHNDFPPVEQVAYVEERHLQGLGTGFYRQARDINGKKYGKHEVTKLNLIYNDLRDPNKSLLT